MKRNRPHEKSSPFSYHFLKRRLFHVLNYRSILTQTFIDLTEDIVIQGFPAHEQDGCQSTDPLQSGRENVKKVSRLARYVDQHKPRKNHNKILWYLQVDRYIYIVLVLLSLVEFNFSVFFLLLTDILMK